MGGFEAWRSWYASDLARASACRAEILARLQYLKIQGLFSKKRKKDDRRSPQFNLFGSDPHCRWEIHSALRRLFQPITFAGIRILRLSSHAQYGINLQCI